MGIAFLLFSVVLPLIIPAVDQNWAYGLASVGVFLLVASFIVAKSGSTQLRARGGRGGKAIASGEEADAVGGAGGNANGGIGGNGGNARATGKGARAKGGAGGAG